MPRNHYQYALALERPDRSSLGQFPTTMDWTPAREWARFEMLRRHDFDALPGGGGMIVEPVWDKTLGEPHVGGVRVTLGENGDASPTVTLATSYFRETAQKISRDLVAKKTLQPREEFHYSVVAFRADTEKIVEEKRSFTVEDVESPPIVKPAAARDLFEQAATFGTQDAEDVPLFIPQQILDEAATLTRAAAADETAGILIGHVCRDPGNRRLFVEVTGLIPAKHTRPEKTAVTFTPETWTAAESAIRLRRGGEIMIGWFHSHPAKFWCSPNCGPEARRDCPLARSFFSDEDCTLHRTVFPVGYGVALVVTHAETGMHHALFGWRHGLIVQRGFHVLNASQAVVESRSGEAIIGESYDEKCN